MKQTRFAIFDPDQNKFLSSQSDWDGPIWTDKVNNIWSYLAYDELPSRLKWVIGKHPNAYIAEIEVSISWKPANRSEIPIDVRYAEEIATYNLLLPQFEADADAMSKREWTKFRNVRNLLREVGYPVCGGLGPVPQKIDYR